MHAYLHHIGDWAAHTAGLSWLELAAYHKLIQMYYLGEQAISPKMHQLFRATHAVTKAEKDAIVSVLEQFFVLDMDDGCWHQKRCDAELTRHGKVRETKVKNVNKRWEGKRITAPNGKHAVDNSSTPGNYPDVAGMMKSIVHDPRLGGISTGRLSASANASEPNGLHDPYNGRITAAFSPITNTLNTSLAAAASVGVACERACEAAAAAGIEINPNDPRLAALVADGALPGEFRMAAARATAAGKGVAWFFATVSGMRRDVASGNAREGTQTGSGSPNYPMLPRWDDPH